jgi:hypothetical protein
MNLLAATLYDPTGGAAVSKATTALLAMTALDTVNLRLTFTVPLSGKVLVRIKGGALHGAATYPVVLLGVLNGAVVVGRIAPNVSVNGAASATTPASLDAEFVVTGLTPGNALTWDLAYGVEQLVAATGLKYGGPNNSTTAGDGFGGISFQIWDPSPDYLATAMPTATTHAKLDTIAGYVDTEVAAILAAVDTEVAAIKAQTDQLTFSGGKVAAQLLAAADFAQAAADKVWATAARTLTASLDPALATIVAGVWDELTATARTAGSYGQLLKDDVDAKISSRAAGADYTAARAAKLDNLDATVSSRSTLTAAAVRAEMDANSTALAAIIAYVDELETRLTAARALLLDTLVHLDVDVSSRAAPGAAMALTGAERTAVADALLDRDLAAGADTGTNATRTVRQAVRALRNKVDVTAGKVYKEDDATQSWSFTSTTAPGDPLVAINPDDA